MGKALALDRCPHGVHAICLDDEDRGTGTRLTPAGCCGRWERVMAFPMSDTALRVVAQTILDECPDD